MVKEKMPFFKKVLLFIIFVILLFGGIYIFISLSYKGEVFPWKTFWSWFFGLLGGFSLIIFIVYFIFKKFNKEDGVVNDFLPKNPVNVRRARSIIVNEFILENNLPFTKVKNDKDDFETFIPIPSDCISISDSRTVVMADVNYLKFELKCKHQFCVKNLVVAVALDYGEDYVKNNWLGNVWHDKTLEMVNLHSWTEPISTKSHTNTLLEVAKLKALTNDDSEYSEEELKYINNLKSKEDVGGEPRVLVQQQEGISSNNFDDSYDDSQVEDFNELEEDIENARQNNPRSY